MIPLIEKLSKRNYSITVVTNGILLSKDVYLKLKSLDVFISISIDGPTAEANDMIRGNGVFSRVSNNIKKLGLDGNCDNIQIKSIVTRYNYLYINEYFDMCHNFKIKKLNFGFLTPTGRSDKLYDLLSINNSERILFVERLTNMSKQYKDIEIVYPMITDVCPIIDFSQKQTLKIASNGSVFPCPIIIDSKYAIGNIYTDYPDEMLMGKAHSIISMNFRERENNYKCAKCALNRLCKAGCPVFASYFHDDINSDDNCCYYRKKRLLKLNRLNNQLLDK